jgi:hypothetical protein
MEKILKYTYLMDVSKINIEIERLYDRYQKILKNPNWENLNEARAILYFIGYLYTEQIAPEAIERRLHLLELPLSSDDFFILIDSKSPKIKLYRSDKLFTELEKFYLLIKKYKNKFSGGKYYLDEEKFMKLYNKYNPDKNLKIGERGKF